MTWKEFVYKLVLDFCNQVGRRTFTLREFYDAYEADFAHFAPDNHHIYAKVRQQFQILRKEKLLSFVDNHGTYTLRGVLLLRDELAEPEIANALPKEEREREYMIEINARDRGWVRLARMAYGNYCLVPDCCNTFQKEDGAPYIEVHHIDPLCDGGEEQIWNLSVVCAHHHRMAHFAVRSERARIRELLIERTQLALRRPESQ